MQISHDVLRKEFAAAATPHHLGLAVSLTEQCNFRCTYCYESFELGAMSPELYAGLKAFVASRIPTLRSFALNWFGGEPLLEWKRMIDLTRYCNELCDKHGVRMPNSTVPTNAWALTPQMMASLVHAGVREYMISLDGDGGVHDQTRKLISGKGTFERVYRNLLDIRKLTDDYKVVLRLHLHSGNVDSQFELVRKLGNDFGADRRFVLHPMKIGDFGGDTVKTMQLLAKGQGPSIASEMKKLFRDEEDTAAPYPSEDHFAVCYAAKPNHIFIRPNGMISKCTSALDRPDNNVGQLLPSGELKVDDKKALAWSFGFQTGNIADLTCPFFTKPKEQPIQIFPRGQAVSAAG